MEDNVLIASEQRQWKILGRAKGLQAKSLGQAFVMAANLLIKCAHNCLGQSGDAGANSVCDHGPITSQEPGARSCSNQREIGETSAAAQLPNVAEAKANNSGAISKEINDNSLKVPQLAPPAPGYASPGPSSSQPGHHHRRLSSD